MSAISCLNDAIVRRAAVAPTQPAVVSGEQVITYQGFQNQTLRVAQRLLALNSQAGSRIAVLAGNNIQFFPLWHGASEAGWVLSPVNNRLSANEVSYVLNDGQAQVLVVDASHEDLAKAILPGLTHVQRVITLESSHDQWECWEDWLTAVGPEPVSRQVSPEDTLIQLYTSGTTGYPKGVELSHSAVLHCARAMMGLKAWEPSEVSLVTAPLFHTAGCAWSQCALQSSGTAVVLATPSPENILAAIESHGVTEALLVPAVINMLLHSQACDMADLSSLRRILYGASPIPVPVLRRAIERFDCQFEQGYGLTETVGPVAMLRPEDHLDDSKLNSCGKPVPGMSARVVNKDLEDVPAGAVGEILIAGPQVMKGYWQRPEDTRNTMSGRWLHTGDAGYFDDDGFLYIHDRVKDMIISGGENVYPAEVESALAGLEGVADVAVIGVPDEKWGEAVKAMVVVKPGTALAAADVIAHARANIAAFKCPKSVDFVDAIPRNASGKILKRVLREPFWAEQKRQVH